MATIHSDASHSCSKTDWSQGLEDEEKLTKIKLFFDRIKSNHNTFII